MTYEYDPANRVRGIEGKVYRSWLDYNRANQVTRITRGEVGQIGFEAASRGANTEYEYWGHSGELRSIEHRWNLSAKRKLRHEYWYNEDGLRREMTIDKDVPDATGSLRVVYEYDSLNRLIGEYGYNRNVDPATSVYERLYHYDGSGNADRIVVADTGVSWTGWTLEYNDQNELTQRYANLEGFGEGSEGDSRWSYTYDANGNLTEKEQETLSGSWGETLRWEYTWDVRNQMTSASKYVSSTYAGKVEYKYSHAYRGQRKERILRDASNDVVSWKRYVNDGLSIYRVEERYDGDEDGIDSGDPWRLKEERAYRPGQIGNLFYKDVYYYPSAISADNATSRTFHYGYDAVGNVIVVNEEYCGGTSFTYAFMQDAFGNPLNIGAFTGDDWIDAGEDDCVYEHQTGKEYDTFTGLYFFHHRWYDAEVGRFVSRDVKSSCDLTSDRSRYAFSGNSPCNIVDPTGNACHPADGSGIDEGIYLCRMGVFLEGWPPGHCFITVNCGDTCITYAGHRPHNWMNPRANIELKENAPFDAFYEDKIRNKECIKIADCCDRGRFGEYKSVIRTRFRQYKPTDYLLLFDNSNTVASCTLHRSGGLGRSTSHRCSFGWKRISQHPDCVNHFGDIGK